MPHVDRLYIYIDYVIYEGILWFMLAKMQICEMYILCWYLGIKQLRTVWIRYYSVCWFIYVFFIYYYTAIFDRYRYTYTFVFTHTFNWRYAMFMVHPHMCFRFHATSVKYIKQTFAMNRYTPLQVVNSMGIPVSNKSKLMQYHYLPIMYLDRWTKSFIPKLLKGQ